MGKFGAPGPSRVPLNVQEMTEKYPERVEPVYSPVADIPPSVPVGMEFMSDQAPTDLVQAQADGKPLSTWERDTGQPDDQAPLELTSDMEVAATRPIGWNFGMALEWLKDGHMVARAGWNGKGQFLSLQRPGPASYMTLPYIFITTVQGDRVPWLASQTDQLAEDWTIVE